MDETAVRKVARRLGIVAMLGMLVATLGVFRGIQELRTPVDVGTLGIQEQEGNQRLSRAHQKVAQDLVTAMQSYRPAETVLAAANIVLSGLLAMACLALFTLRPSGASLFTQASVSNAILAVAGFGLWVAKARAMVPVLRAHAPEIVQATAAGDPALSSPEAARTAELFVSAGPWIVVLFLFFLLVLELGFLLAATNAVRKDDVRALLAWAEEARQRDRE